LPGDLADPAEPERLATLAANHLGHVDVLINNAGFATPGFFHRTDLDRVVRMLQVNVVASVELAHRVLPGMIERGHGGILNVSSMAGFQAAPYTSAYGGTKAFLLNWSDGLHQEYKDAGVSISALCPGVTDTEFFDAAGYTKLTGYLNKRMSSERVARAGLSALRRGKMGVVPGLLNSFSIFMERFFSRSFVAATSRRLMGGRPLPARRR
ncbi:MAG: SDR family NAD(P)-dependent oxidoreductase, partial [Planctomycetota bacterium]|nr:SDR family NAD(P)-dependent oxidoreductase [Planctomycetota bacterium]